MSNEKSKQSAAPGAEEKQSHAPGGNRQCISCKQKIPDGATLCSICKSHQSGWKNTLQYFAGMAALLVVAASGSGWVYANLRKALAPDDVKLISCSTINGAVVVNRGEREVFVSRMLLYMAGRSSSWVAPELIFQESLPAGHFLQKKFAPSKIDEGRFIRGLNRGEFEKVLERASNHDPCLEPAFFSLNDNSLRDLESMAGPTLNTFEVAGHLEYFGVADNTPQSVPITGVGVVRIAERPECRER